MKIFIDDGSTNIKLAWLEDEPPRESWRLNFLRKR